jgi:DNA-binding MarR family transcriptional regulator
MWNSPARSNNMVARLKLEEQPRASTDEAGKGAAVAELMLEVAQCFFKIRAFGQKEGFITGWGGGAFGFLRSLALLGPLTVPKIAQMRPTSRQRMQRLADDLAAEGLVEFVDNPNHLRSKLVQLTKKGARRYRELDARLVALGATMAYGIGEAEIRRTTAVVRRLGMDVGGQEMRTVKAVGSSAPSKR